MPNILRIDGQPYNFVSASMAARLFARALHAIRRAATSSGVQLLGWDSEANGDPVWVAVLVTPSSAVSLILDRDDSNPAAVALGERIQELDAAYLAEVEREMAEEGVAASSAVSQGESLRVDDARE